MPDVSQVSGPALRHTGVQFALCVCAIAFFSLNAVAGLLSAGAFLGGTLLSFNQLHGFYPFFFSALTGCAICAIALFAFSKQTIQLDVRKLVIPAAIIFIVAGTLFVISTRFSDGSSAPFFMLSGLLTACAYSLLLVACQALFRGRAQKERVFLLSAGLSLSALLTLVLFSSNSTVVMLTSAVGSPLVATLLIWIAGKTEQTALTSDRNLIAEPTEALPVAGTHNLLIILFGACICAFMLGLMWSMPGIRENDEIYSAITRSSITGFLFGTLLLAVIGMLYGNPNKLYALLLRISPLMLLLPTIPCIVPLEPVGAIGIIFGLLTGAGFAFFAVMLLWLAFGAHNPFLDEPTTASCSYQLRDFGIILLAISITIVLSAGIAPLLSDQLKTYLPLLLVLIYLALLATRTTITNTSIQSGYNKQANTDDMQPEDTTPSLEEYCVQLGKQHALSNRESEVLALLARGRTATYIAKTLYVSPETVKVHIRHIYEKLNVHSRSELLDLFQELR